MAELLLGQPIFPGDSGVDQLVEIIKVWNFKSCSDCISLGNQHENMHCYKLVNIYILSPLYRVLHVKHV